MTGGARARARSGGVYYDKRGVITLASEEGGRTVNTR